jgi:hypothetical protein
LFNENVSVREMKLCAVNLYKLSLLAMSFVEMKTLRMNVVSLLVYGAPGIGKSTLLSNLEARNTLPTGHTRTGHPHYYLVVDEPTDEQEVREAIRQVYEERPVAPPAVSARQSKTVQVQTLIAERRMVRLKACVDVRLPAALVRAHAQGFETLVVVFDGSPLTDAYIYTGGRALLGQVSALEAEKEIASWTITDGMGSQSNLLDHPDATLLLEFESKSGQMNKARVMARDDELDSEVAAETFGAFVVGADSAYEAFVQSDKYEQNHHRLVIDWMDADDVERWVDRQVVRPTLSRCQRRYAQNVFVRTSQPNATPTPFGSAYHPGI